MKAPTPPDAEHADIEIADQTACPHGAGLDLPAYATPDSAGMDLLAAVEEDVVLAPGERRLIPTGLAIALPPGYEAQVRPRSGLARASTASPC